MAIHGGKKRAGQSVAGPSKKRRVDDSKDTRNVKHKTSKAKGKEKAADRGFVPIPVRDDEEFELSDGDMQLFEEYGEAASFLNKLDEKGIARQVMNSCIAPCVADTTHRSKKETDRLHRLYKPQRAQVEDDLPSLNSDDENEDEDDGEEWSSALPSGDEDSDVATLDQDTDAGDESEASSSSHTKFRRREKKPESDNEEMPYETLPRKPNATWESDPKEEEGILRLPIKLADGRIQKSGSKVFLTLDGENSDDDSDEDMQDVPQEKSRRVEDVSTGARFGRPAVVDVITTKSRKSRVQAAKEQIAGICQEILADPENSLGLLRRLNTFALPEITTPSHPQPVPNDPLIRKLTFVSQLAVFKDIIPGYRIRALTDKEKAEKVSQMVQRTRDWEQGLVGVYQSYLRCLETELKARSELAEVALQCMCALLVEVTHFNFRVNLMSAVVSNLSRKSWDKSSDLCLSTLITVFRADQTGAASLEIVRLLNRMIKERKFNVHPDVLSCLSHLRLKTELGVRASETKADRPEGKSYAKGKAAARRAKGKLTDQPHLSKKAKKALKERKEIQKEMQEAAAEVDKEERTSNQTETLKLLFVLYFRILKNPQPTPLLPAALRGIAKFSHLVNVDFFKDLMQVLKELTSRESTHLDDSGIAATATDPSSHARDVQHQLLCIVTAFELLSGQGQSSLLRPISAPLLKHASVRTSQERPWT
ncbi:hypothetical protein NM688_g5457 [Phlebia brevispora]|uniref:Uncharacterized protein n=1 Tax=Phlebia brevispora TaxID=194682 RepID=A0ACC1SV39_9APHY|nr:hypothetical protein NM688_g5457 [Phlebia brevispora]